MTSAQLSPAADAALDRIARLAAQSFGVPIALIRLIDRDGNWTSYGQATPVAQRDAGFCLRTLQGDNVVVVPDTLEDPQFASHPLVRVTPGIRFYAGAPLKIASGLRMGSLCILDFKPRQLAPDEIRMLTDLAALAVDTLEARATAALGGENDPRPGGHAGLEHDRLLETVVHNLRLQDTLTQLVHMIEHQCPGLLCSILLLRDGRFYHAVAPSLPESYRRAPDLIQDLRPCGSSPILSASGELLGVCSMYSRDTADPGPADRELLQTASRMAAIAIEQCQLTEQLAHMARHDPLTGLPNRTFFGELLPRTLEKADRENQFAAIVFLDLDRFKQINDTLGHGTGDLLLHEVGQRLKSCLREDDNLARMGGDEFTLILSGLPQPEHAVVVANRVLEALRQPFRIEERELWITASLGVSIYPQDARDAATLLRNADSAMYRVKNLGRNGLQCFTPEITSAAFERLELEDALRHALDSGQLQLYYQPRVDATGRLGGLQALLVWNHPRFGRLPQEQFLAAAEESGLTVPIGNWILEQACLQNAAWQQAGLPALKVTVKVSSAQLARPDFVDSVTAALSQSGLEPRLLELEIAALSVKDIEETADQIRRLRALGVNLSIDAFTTARQLDLLHPDAIPPLLAGLGQIRLSPFSA